MSEWIKCSERMPEEEQLVILSGYLWGNPSNRRFVEPSVFSHGEFHPIAYDDGDYEIAPDFDATMVGDFWMPFPDAPKEKS